MYPIKLNNYLYLYSKQSYFPCLLDLIWQKKGNLLWQSVKIEQSSKKNMNHSLTHLLTTSNQEMLAHLKSNLRAHKKRVHEKTIDAIPPKHACGLCGYRTNGKVSLSSHNKKCNRFLNQNSSITLVTSVTRSFLQTRF